MDTHLMSMQLSHVVSWWDLLSLVCIRDAQIEVHVAKGSRCKGDAISAAALRRAQIPGQGLAGRSRRKGGGGLIVSRVRRRNPDFIASTRPLDTRCSVLVRTPSRCFAQDRASGTNSASCERRARPVISRACEWRRRSAAGRRAAVVPRAARRPEGRTLTAHLPVGRRPNQIWIHPDRVVYCRAGG